MKESVVYQEIIEEGVEQGRAAAARSLVILLGAQRFGPPNVQTRDELEAIADIARLERIMSRMLDSSVNSWRELLT